MIRPRYGGRAVVCLAAFATLTTAAACSDDDTPTAAPSASGSPTGAPTFTPGAPGIGDPYFPTFGNGGYDVDSYALKLRYDPAKDTLEGTATIAAKATQDLSRFNFDLVGLEVSAVTVDGAPAQNARDGGELVVTPADGIRKDATFTTVVTYGGVPKAVKSPELGEGGWLHTADGAIALGQPESASTWYPVNDHPKDKATFSLEITVPSRLEALSNGSPGQKTVDGDWTTWRWSEGTPMASYLSTLVIGEYTVKSGTHKGKPMVTALANSLPQTGLAQMAMDRTGEISDFLETQFGPYPFEAYGGVVVDDERIRYALETQSRPVYGKTFFNMPGSDWVVAHEIAHQWFGDSVSIASWKDIWLNEGFASYAEWLWLEKDRRVPVKTSFDREYASTNWSSPTYDPGRAGIFGNAVYRRGALTVHALRMEVGDEAFFKIVKTWAEEKRNTSVTTDDFIEVAERVSGKELREFLMSWLTSKTAVRKPGS